MDVISLILDPLMQFVELLRSVLGVAALFMLVLLLRDWREVLDKVAIIVHSMFVKRD